MNGYFSSWDCWTKSELFFRKTLIQICNLSRRQFRLRRNAKQKKFPIYLYCAPILNSIKKERKFFCFGFLLRRIIGGSCPASQDWQAGKNSFPQTPFLFARLLWGFGFLAEGKQNPADFVL